jgi:hypothetical protein
VAGKYRIYGGAYNAPAITLTTSDMASGFEVATKPPRRDLFNSVRGKFMDPARFWQSSEFTPVKSAALIAEDGEEIWREIDLREKQNLKYYYPVDLNPCVHSLFQVLCKQILNGSILAFKDEEFVVPYERSEVRRLLVKQDTVPQFIVDEFGNEKEVMWSVADSRLAHNEQFDARIMRIAYKRFRDDTYADAFKAGAAECTMRMATQICKLPPTEKMRRAGRNGFKQPNLGEAYKYFTGKTLEGAHSALVDVKGDVAGLHLVERRIAECAHQFVECESVVGLGAVADGVEFCAGQVAPDQPCHGHLCGRLRLVQLGPLLHGQDVVATQRYLMARRAACVVVEIHRVTPAPSAHAWREVAVYCWLPAHDGLQVSIRLRSVCLATPSRIARATFGWPAALT